MIRKLTIVLLLLTVVALAGVPQASAFPSFLTTFEGKYGPAVNGSRIDTCELCHINPAGGGARNPYGLAFQSNGENAAALTTIEPLDSDGDGFTNIIEIHNLTFPGNASDFPPVITSFTPASPVNDTVGASRTFTVTVNQPLNVIWLINGTQAQNTMTIGANNQSTYTNTSAAQGTWNVSAIAQKTGDGSAMQTWIWNVGAPISVGTFNISGFKINNATKSGIPGWNITITNTTMNKTMQTGADGSYKFTGLVNGTYNMSEEMRPAEFTPVGATFHLETIAGQDITNVNFTNAPVTVVKNGTIAGKVTNVSSGLAISGATVIANGMMATTNATGNYSISIAAGTYNVTASATGYQSNTITGVVVTQGNVTTQNFALTPKPVATFNVSGFKINDTNGNGVWNPGEMGIENWNINLLNAAGTLIDRTSTNATGFYEFMDLAPGTYNVTEETKAGFTPTNATFRVITIENMDVTNVNFTNTPVIVIPQTFSISGFKINGATGSGIPGWNITITNATMQKSMLTGADGSYKFTDLINGTYNVSEEMKPGFTPVGATFHLETIAGQNITNVNFTNQQIVPTFSISGFKINGATGEGIQGWLISAKNATTGALIFNTTTNAAGMYLIPSLTNGTYTVVEETRAGFTPNGPTSQNVTINGADVTNINFTNTPVTPVKNGSISGNVINVATGMGVPNVTIRLVGIVGMGVDTKTIRMETMTDSMGMWMFENLPAGRYIIIEQLPKGFIPVTPPVMNIMLEKGQNSINNNFKVNPISALTPSVPLPPPVRTS